MKRIKTRMAARAACLVLLTGIAGCVSSNSSITGGVFDPGDGSGAISADGWGWAGNQSEPAVKAAPVSRTSKSGVCLVRSPAIEKSQRGVGPGHRSAAGFVWKDALCDNAVGELLIKDLRRRLRDLGYRIEAATAEPDPSTQATFERFKRDEGIYGEGYLFEALEELDLDPATYVIEAALRLLTQTGVNPESR